MADIHLALQELFKAEFNNKPELFLHKNSGESTHTIGGVYRKANPTGIDWYFVTKILSVCDEDMKRASKMLYYDAKTMNEVVEVFKKNYWLPLHLDRVESQKIATEIFLFSVLTGVRNGSKLAQKTVGAVQDGLIGLKTLEALNNYNESDFDKDFDKLEIEHFENLVDKRPEFERFLAGWKSRSYLV